MGNQSDREKGCGSQLAAGGWSCPVFRSLTQLVFSVLPLMKQERVRGASMLMSMVKSSYALSSFLYKSIYWCTTRCNWFFECIVIQRGTKLYSLNEILLSSSSPVPPSIRTSGPAEQSVVLHKSISLDCISSGIPPPSITWLKSNRPLDTTQKHLKVG